MKIKTVEKQLFFFTFQTFRKLLSSYALLLILPLLVSILLYSIAVSIISQEINRANYASLYQIKGLLDTKLSELYVLADQLSINEKVYQVSLARKPVSINHRLAMTDVQKLLRDIGLANTFIKEIYIYFPNIGYVLSNISRFRIDEFEIAVERKFNMSINDWEKIVLSNSYRDVHILDNRSKPTFFVTQKLIYDYDKDAGRAVVIILVDENKLSKLLNTLEWGDSSSVLIVAPDGSNIVSPSDIKNTYSFINYSELYKQKGERQIRNNNIFMMTTNSDVCDWHYISLISSDKYLRSVNIVRNFMYCYIALWLIGGFILSFFLAKRNYTPIYRLTNIFIEQLGYSDLNKRGDFPFLEESLHKLLKENANLAQTLYEQKEMVRNKLLEKLISGNYTKIDVLLKSCEACDVYFLSQYFLLMGIIINKIDTSSFDNDITVDSQTEDLIRIMIQSVLKRLNEKHYVGYNTEMGDTIVCLISLPANEGQSRDFKNMVYEIMSIADEICTLFSEGFGISLSFAISNVVDSIYKLPIALSEINRTIEYITLYAEENSVVHYSCIQLSDEDVKIDNNNSISSLRNIITRIQIGDFSGVRDEINKYIEKEILKENIPLWLSKARMGGLANVLMELLIKLASNCDGDFFEELINSMEKLNEINTIYDFQKEVQRIFNEMDKFLISRSEEKMDIRIDEIVKYIEEHYSESDLNVSSIADNFGISLPYLSKMFKKQTGVGVLDYIHLCRLREAKKLLKESKMSIQDIACKVGYGSRISMVRAFKRYEGTIPSEYRNNELS